MSSFYYDLTETPLGDAYRGLLKLARDIYYTPQRPVFILVEQINSLSDASPSRISAVEFTLDNLDFIFSLLENPSEGWSLFNRRSSSVGSDVVQKLAFSNENNQELWITKKIAFYDTNQATVYNEGLSETVFKDFLNSIPPYTEYQQHNNGVFNAKFNPNYHFRDDNVRVPKYFNDFWSKIVNSPSKRKDLCYKKQFLDEVLDSEEKKAIGTIPCAIYSIKQCDVPPAVIQSLYNCHICYGNIIKTRELRAILNSFKIRLRIYKVSYQGNKIKISYNEYPKKKTPENADWNTISLDFFKGHLMCHEEIPLSVINQKGEEKIVNVPFLRLLYYAFEDKLLVPMNNYEFYSLFGNRGFSLNYKQNTKELIESMEEGEIFDNYITPFSAKSKTPPSRVVFADFECSTNEKYHIPYCISYTDINSPQIYHKWGRDCAKMFLDDLKQKCLEIVSEEKQLDPFDRTTNLYWKRPICVVYFHNLRYDFTFLLKHLRHVKIIKKGQKLYAAKGRYGKGFGKICIEFRDTLPLLQMSLKNAGNAFLNEKQKETIRKEVFPYDMYTYDFFEKNPSGWVDVKEAKSFFTEEQYEEFLLNLKKTLPFIPKEEGNLLSYSSNMYIQQSVTDPETGDLLDYIEKFNYKEYVFFYCDQDVRVLYYVMDTYKNLMTGRGAEGIVGAPPFGNKYDPFKYLTISSLAYDFNLKSCVVEWKQALDEYGKPAFTRKGEPIMKWLPKHDYYKTSGLLRYIGHQTIRGGRVMTRDNTKWHYKADPNNPLSMLVDYDGVSLYPSAISLLWMTEGKPSFIKGDFSEKEFLERFTHPDAPEGEFKDYNDGWVHITNLDCRKERHFPQLSIKDEKTKLNEYQNFHGPVDTWVNAIDLFNLIEFQDAIFRWDAAVVWKGKRYYECRSMIRSLFEFRTHNKKHPIQLTTKLMMNSIYGKSALKPTNYQTHIIDSVEWRKSGEETNIQWEKINKWREVFNANAYRIKKFTFLDFEHIEVKYHELDMGSNYVQFGSNVLAMARRIIGRVMALAEDMEELHPECAPGLFYTDTDSMHIRADLLKYTEEAYMEKYGKPICGTDLCQFHVDFDSPNNYKEHETVIGADESWFIMKKMYADRLIGSEGSIGYHQRMKGIPSDLVHWEHYEKIYNNEFVMFDMLANGHVSFYYENGNVGSLCEMTRQIALREARLKMKEDLDVVNNFVKALEKLEKAESGVQKRARGVPEEEIETEGEEEIEFHPPALKRVKAQGNIEVE